MISYRNCSSCSHKDLIVGTPSLLSAVQKTCSSIVYLWLQSKSKVQQGCLEQEVQNFFFTYWCIYFPERVQCTGHLYSICHFSFVWFSQAIQAAVGINRINRRLSTCSKKINISFCGVRRVQYDKKLIVSVFKAITASLPFKTYIHEMRRKYLLKRSQ